MSHISNLHSFFSFLLFFKLRVKTLACHLLGKQSIIELQAQPCCAHSYSILSCTTWFLAPFTRGLSAKVVWIPACT